MTNTDDETIEVNLDEDDHDFVFGKRRRRKFGKKEKRKERRKPLERVRLVKR